MINEKHKKLSAQKRRCSGTSDVSVMDLRDQKIGFPTKDFQRDYNAVVLNRGAAAH